MPQKGRSFPFARSAKSLQEGVTRSAPVAVAAYSLVGGIILAVLHAFGIGGGHGSGHGDEHGDEHGDKHPDEHAAEHADDHATGRVDPPAEDSPNR